MKPRMLFIVVTVLMLAWPARLVSGLPSVQGGEAQPAESGVYVEDFAAYTAKDYTDQTVWDIWAGSLRLARLDAARQYNPAIARDGNGNLFVVWQDDRNGNWDIYAQKLDANGNPLWAADVRVNADGGPAWPYSPAVAVDGSGNAVVVWEDDRNSNGDIYAQKLDGAGNRLWAQDAPVNSDGGTAWPYSPAVAVDGSGNAFVVWEDYCNGNGDIYVQKINQAGGKAWPADLQVVYPDLFYLPTGAAQSRTIDTLAAAIHQATLTADYALNGGNVQFYLTNDGGAHWAAVTPGVTHVFTTAGSDLRWRAVLTGDPLWRSRTPVVNSLRIEYSTAASGGDDYEPDDTCAQARPIGVNGAAQAHTFHQQADADWVWFEASAGVTYTLQTAHAGPRADTVLKVYDACGQTPLQTDDNAFGPGATLTFQAPASGRYYALVRQHDPAIYGNDTNYELSVRAQLPNGAAIIVAGRLKVNDNLQPIINNTANLAYQTFVQGSFSPDNIQYLSADLSQPGVDGLPTKSNVREAIQTWARARVGLGVPLWVYLVDHGNVDRFHNEVNEVVTAGELNLWLSNLEAASGVDQINIIFDACFSGSFIDLYQSGAWGLEEISGHGRVVVASTTSHWWAYAPPILPGQPIPLMYFSDGFWHALGNSQSVWNAFLAGRAAVEAGGQRCGDYAYTCQRPWLDDTGDAWFDGSDGLVAQGRGLAASFGAAVAPYIDWVEVGAVGADGAASVQAQVRDDGSVAQVWARIFAPSFEPPTSTDGAIPVIIAPTATLSLVGSDVYQAEYADFTEPGVYQVVVYALDYEGNAASPKWVLVGEKKVYLPLVLRKS